MIKKMIFEQYIIISIDFCVKTRLAKQNMATSPHAIKKIDESNKLDLTLKNLIVILKKIFYNAKSSHRKIRGNYSYTRPVWWRIKVSQQL